MKQGRGGERASEILVCLNKLVVKEKKTHLDIYDHKLVHFTHAAASSFGTRPRWGFLPRLQMLWMILGDFIPFHSFRRGCTWSTVGRSHKNVSHTER